MNADRAAVALGRAALAAGVVRDATPDELARAVAAVAALIGGPHCAVDGKGAEDWVLVATATLLAEGRPLPDGLPLWVALRDRAAERLAAYRQTPAASAMAEFRALERRVIARIVPQRLDPIAERVLLAMYEGTTRTEDLAHQLGLAHDQVLAARRAIADIARTVAAELRGGPRRG